jgi:hypothetical protein
MENKKTDTGKDQRIVLNLNLIQAQVLSKACMDARLNTVLIENQKIMLDISKRIDKTILKQAYITRCMTDGLGKPTKEQMKSFWESLK